MAGYVLLMEQAGEIDKERKSDLKKQRKHISNLIIKYS